MHGTIVEPFAGAAGYATRHHARRVRLFDVDPVIVGVWSYLIRVSSSEVLALPDIGADGIPDTLPQEARWLIGFWLNKGNTHPSKTPSAWMRAGTHLNSFWGNAIRQRIASQVDSIRHWTITQTSWADLDTTTTATWFVDPPYQCKAGRHYSHDTVDFPALGAWCQRLHGQVIVCEQDGADWLPFTHHKIIKANPSNHGGKQSSEAIWTNNV
jgi:hypothetical protein